MRPVFATRLFRAEVHAVAVGRDAIACAGGYDTTLLDEHGALVSTLGGPLAAAGNAAAVVALPDGSFASAGRDHSVRVWTPAGVVRTVIPQEEMLRALAASADGAWLAYIDAGGALWCCHRSETKFRLQFHFGLVRALAFIDDEAISGGDDGQVRVWPREGASPKLELQVSDAWIYALAVLPARRLVVADGAGGVTLWDLEGGRCLARAQRAGGPVTQLALLSDGRHVVGVSYDRFVRVWDTGAGGGPFRATQVDELVCVERLRPEELGGPSGARPTAVAAARDLVVVGLDRGVVLGLRR